MYQFLASISGFVNHTVSTSSILQQTWWTYSKITLTLKKLCPKTFFLNGKIARVASALIAYLSLWKPFRMTLVLRLVFLIIWWCWSYILFVLILPINNIPTSWEPRWRGHKTTAALRRQELVDRCLRQRRCPLSVSSSTIACAWLWRGARFLWGSRKMFPLLNRVR